MATTKIEWCDSVWNPVTGCTPISEGCNHCYAKRMANRLRERYGYPADDPFRVTFHTFRLGEPERMKKPRRIFVCSMSDIFHKDVSDDYLDCIFSVITKCSHHTFMVLTKRPNRMLDYISDWPHPMSNLWLGVTAENQARADERIPILLQIPAAVRFVSVEPMLEYLRLDCLGPDGEDAAGWNTLSGEQP